jgi:hypothetical protein
MKSDKEVSESITISVPASIIKTIVVCSFAAWVIWILHQMFTMASQAHR